jgi:general secretion pathway protein C
MGDGANTSSRHFARLAAGLAVVSILAFVYLSNRDPRPATVPSPATAESEGTPAQPAGTPTPASPPPVVSVAPPAGGPTAAESTGAVPSTSLQLRLLATAVQEDPSRSFARIDDAQLSGARLMVQGQVFEGRPNVTLVTIESDSVLLDNYGRLERLLLDPDGTQFAGDASLGGPVEPGFELSDEARARRRALGGRLQALVEDADLRPLYADGELVGVQLNAIRPESPLARAGLRDGDVVRSVNGVSLGAPTAAADLLAQVVAGEPLEVAVERSDGSVGVIPLPTQELLLRAADFDDADSPLLLPSAPGQIP